MGVPVSKFRLYNINYTDSVKKRDKFPYDKTLGEGLYFVADSF